MDASPARSHVFNAEFDASEVPLDARSAFWRGQIEKRCLPAGFDLFRSGSRPLVEAGGRIAESWRASSPPPIPRPGERLIHVRLACAVWAFVGREAGPLADARGLDGGLRVWIPNLTRAQIVPIAP